MKANSFRKVLPVMFILCFLVMVAACSTVSAPAQNEIFVADGVSDVAFKLTNGSFDGFEKVTMDSSQSSGINWKADDMLWVTVRLGDGAAESFLKQSAVSSIGQYIASGEGAVLVQGMKASQQEVISAISAQEMQITVKHSYTTAVNGFAAYVRYGDIAAIEAMPGVESVVISEKYSVPTTSPANYYAGGGSAGAGFAGTGIFEDAVGNGGEGTIVAIIDTGVEAAHDAFATIPYVQMLDVEFISSVIESTNAYALMGGLTAANTYYSGKIPFQFDYADKNVDATPSLDQIWSYNGSHGTHVAGIAVGNNDVIQGAAYNAQLVAMKVFSDMSAGAYDVDILAAVEDCMILGVDVMNLSLGSPCGFTSYIGDTLSHMASVYELVSDLGIICNVATGNDSSAFIYADTLQTFNKATNPDNGVVGVPASLQGNFAIGSVDNIVNLMAKVGEEEIVLYNSIDANQYHYNFLEILQGEKSKTFEYVVVPGMGEASDYEGIDVRGKIAVVMRGGISFEDKQANAADAGAVGCIIYNNEVATTITQAQIVNLTIPTVMTTIENGQLLVEATEKYITISEGDLVYNYSYFSSMGALEDMTIGVDIMGVGGSIYSAVPYWYDAIYGTNGYTWMSGTSMATPNITGITASFIGYLKDMYPEKSRIELREMVYQILMSTADIVYDDGLPVTPRQQGAGLANLAAAVETNAYLTVTGSDKTKLNLGSDIHKDGIYTMRFNLVNMGAKALTYDVDVLAFTESTWVNTANRNILSILQQAHMFENIELSVSARNATVDGMSVTVEAGQTAKITVRMVLSEEDKAYMDEYFANGIYVEGFVVLNGENKLSVPFISFYGDWNALPAFENTMYDEEPATWLPFGLVANRYDEFNGVTLIETFTPGYYGYYRLGAGYNTPKFNKDAISMSLGYDPITGETVGLIIDSVNVFALRNLSTVTFKMYDGVTGEVFDENTFHDLSKFCGKNQPALTFTELYPDYNLWANNQIIVMEFGAEFNGVKLEETKTFVITVDLEAPTLEKAAWRVENGRTYLDLSVFDNNVLQATGLLTGSGTEGVYDDLYMYMIPSYDFEKNSVNAYSIDVTDHLANVVDGKFAIQLVDYAFNEVIYEIELPEAIQNSVINKSVIAVDGNNSYVFDKATGELLNAKTSVSLASIKERLGVADVDYTVYPNAEGEEFVIENGVLKQYNGEGGDVVVPDGVISTANGVFAQNDKITSITFPEGFTTLGMQSIAYLKNLKKLVFPSTFTTMMGENLFSVPALEDINIEDTQLYQVGYCSFIGMTGIKELTFPDAEKPLEMTDSLMVVFGLEKLTFLGEVKDIQNSITMIEGLKSVEFCKKVGTIDGTAAWGETFRVVDQLETITFHDDLERIGFTKKTVMGSFVSVSTNNTGAALVSLKKIEFFGNVGIIDGCLGNGSDKLSEVIFHKNVGSIGSRAFGGANLEHGYTIAEGNEYLVKDEFNVVYNKDKTKMYIPTAWDYEGTFVIPDTITVLEERQFSTPNMIIAKQTPSFGFYDDGTPWFNNTTTMLGGTMYKTKLQGVVLNDSITVIPTECFAFNVNMREINLENIVEFGDRAFLDSGIAGTIEFKDGVTVGQAVIGNCKNIENVILSENATYKNWSAFFDGVGFKEFALPAFIPASSITFMSCTNLEKITFLNENVTSLGYYTFYGCENLVEVNGLDKLKSVPGYCFYQCESLNTIRLESVRSLSYYAFANCYSLENVDLPALETMGNYAFGNCTSLKRFTLGANVRTFDFANIFYGCSNFEGIDVHPDNKYFASVDGVLFDKAVTTILKYPALSPNIEFTVPETVVELGGSVFENALKLKEVTILGVEYIGERCFANSGVTKVIVSEKLNAIDNEAFINSQLEEIDLSNVELFGSNVFENTQLKEVTLNAMTYNGVKVFANIETLEKVTIGACDAFNFSNIFYNCENVKEVVIMDNCQAFVVENEMLMRTDKAVIYRYLGNEETVVIAEGVVKVDMQAFAGNTSVKKVVFPETLKVIGDKAFYGCTSLETLEFKSNTAPVLEALFRRGARYVYANFVTEIENVGEGLDIEVICSDDASFFTPIWNNYFKR